MIGRIRACVAVLILSVSLMGCATFIKIPVSYHAPKDFEVPGPAEKVDLKVGLYIPPELRAYEIREERGGVVAKFKIGEALSDGIERMFKNTFSDVVLVDSAKVDAAALGVRAIVVPEIDAANFRIAAISDKHGSSLIIRVKYEAKDETGKSLWMDTFEGEGVKKASITGSGYEECMKRGLENHFRKASSGLLESKWWESLPRN